MSDRPSVTRVVKYIRKGVGISYTNVEYADSTSNSVAPTSGWQTTAPAWQNGHYIWQRVHIVYTDGTDGYSNPVCLSGGKGISKIEEYYLATSSASGVTTSTSGWTKAIQSVTAEKKYLWNYEVVTYTDGTNTVTTPVIIGVYGDKGVGVSSITEHYLATSASSGVTRSTSGWTTTIQSVTATKKYLWNYETVNYTDGTTVNTDPVIIGVYGDKGDKGDKGPALRGPQAWSDCAVGYSFMQGAENEAYADVVLYNGDYYNCIKSHTKAADNYPTSTKDTTNGYWKLGEKVDLIATRILLATYALVKNLGVETIDMKDGNGNILFQAKDGSVICKTGTFENVLVKGGLRSPFTYLGQGGTFSDDFSDNVAVYSASESTYALPWTTDQSGRKVVITNYYWNGNYSTATGYAKLTAPTGKYFYEDGVQKSTIKLSREAVELLGYGDTSNFYGWIVLKRIDLGTVSRYGHGMKMLAVGRVTGTASGATISYHSFDGTTLTVSRGGTGVYTVSWNNSSWFADANSVFAMVCGYGVIVENNDNPLYASVKTQTKTSITVQTADDDSRNDGSFSFFLMNFDDWIYLH